MILPTRGGRETVEALHSFCENELSDSVLVAAAKNGNTEAFEHLILRHERRVINVAQRIVNNREDAEDVAQESFHKAFLHIGSFQGKSLFSSWVTRITMNEAFMVLRRRNRAIEVSQEPSDDDAQSLAETFVEQGPSPEQSCWQQERVKFLNMAINRLSPKLREAIVLFDIEEHSVHETARILGTSVAAVKSRLNHGREKLRETINPGHQFGILAADHGEARCQ